MKDLNFGHIVIQKDGKECTCGSNGCFETYCSMKNLKQEIASKRNQEKITGKELYDIIKNATKEEKEIIDEFLQNLNIGLSNLINIFEPEAICIGGSFAYYKDLLLDPLVSKMNKNNMAFNTNIPDILVAEYGNDAGIIGATI